jgi:RND family efflux transporter MFP subunit
LELKVREADRVSKGDVLARVDTRRLQAARIQLEADLAMGAATLVEREAQLANSTADLEALASAAESGAVSERDLRNARTAVETRKALAQAAKQSIASLEAARDLIDLRIGDATVRAPFDARIVKRHAEIGQWIRPGDPLVTLVSTGPLEAWLELPERFSGRLDSGAESIRIRLEASGFEVTGTRPRSVPMVDERARTFTLILDVAVAEDGERLQPGMSISAEIPLGESTERLVVAKDAVLRRGTDALVAKVGEGNLAELVPVTVLFTTPTGFAVEPLVPDSLKPGDQVVIEGNERLYPGTPVDPQERPQG